MRKNVASNMFPHWQRVGNPPPAPVPPPLNHRARAARPPGPRRRPRRARASLPGRARSVPAPPIWRSHIYGKEQEGRAPPRASLDPGAGSRPPCSGPTHPRPPRPPPRPPRSPCWEALRGGEVGGEGGGAGHFFFLTHACQPPAAQVLNSTAPSGRRTSGTGRKRVVPSTLASCRRARARPSSLWATMGTSCQVRPPSHLTPLPRLVAFSAATLIALARVPVPARRSKAPPSLCVPPSPPPPPPPHPRELGRDLP